MNIFRGGLEKIIEQQVSAIKEQVKTALAELAKERLEGKSGDGLATVIVLGTGDLVEVKINPEGLRPERRESVQRAISQAINDALTQARKLRQEKLGGLAGGMMGFLGEDLLGSL